MFRERNRENWLKICHNNIGDSYKGTNKEQAYVEFCMLRSFYRIANRQGLPVPNCEMFNCSESEILSNINKMINWFPEYNDTINHAPVKNIAALAQHYGMPTRMLDWSYSFNVALYFAASNTVKQKLMGPKKVYSDDAMVLWMLNKKIIDAINASLLGNGEKLDTYIRFVTPLYYMNPNIKLQKGVLTYIEERISNCTKLDISSLENHIKITIDEIKKFIKEIHIESPILYKFMIPFTEYKAIIDYLKLFACDASAIFDGYSGVVKAVEDISFSSENIKN